MTPKDLDDAELVRAANDGDAEAFAALYLRHREWAWRVAWRILGDRELASDAVQDAFRQALGCFPGFELRARFTTWLFPVVKNAALMIRRRRRGDDSGDVPEIAVDPGLAGAGLESAETRRALISALAGLPEGHRDAVLLRFADGLSLEAVAEALDIPLGTAKSRLHHALKKLGEDPALKKLFER